MATLRLVPASGSAIEIDGERAVVGRDAGCDVVVNDVSVSRKHARIERWGSNWAVIDQRSANGTFLDGQRVAETVLSSGQELRFGGVAYRVEIEEYTAGATVLMPMPAMSDATVLQPPAAPRPGPPAPPAPATPAARPTASPAAAPARPAAFPAPAPAPPAARPAAPQRRAPPVPPAPHPPEPVEKGKGPLFWTALGCGGILLVGLVVFGAIVGGAFYKSRGAVEAVHAQLEEIRDGNLYAAYARTSASYQAAHPATAFATFVERHPGLKANTGADFTNRSVENDAATLSGTLAHDAGTQSVVYRLGRERDGWKITGIAVDGTECGTDGSSVTDADGLTIDILGVNKVKQGQAVAVKIDVRVSGFDLRPEGSLFRLDLAEDLETFGPDGRRLDELSRADLETFNQTTASAIDATATFKTSLTFARPDPGKYRAIITIRDKIGGKSQNHEVPFDLP
jgi:hypothetical protein